MSKQGENNKDVTKIVKVLVPTSWPTIRSSEEIDAAGKWAAKARVKAELSTSAAVNIGQTSSTYRSKGSTGKEAKDPTYRHIKVAGKDVKWQVYPLVEKNEALYPYFCYVDLWQNYIKAAPSASMLIDISVLYLADVDVAFEVLTKLGGVDADDFAKFVTLAEGVLAFYGITLPENKQSVMVSVSDGSTTPATANAPQTAPTDLDGLFD